MKINEKINEIKFKLCDLENQTINYGNDLLSQKESDDDNNNALQFNKQ